MIGEQSNTPSRLALLEQLDLADGQSRIVVGADDKQNGLVLGQRRKDQVFDLGCRRDNPKTRRT
jgi:hypothetical protein